MRSYNTRTLSKRVIPRTMPAKKVISKRVNSSRLPVKKTTAKRVMSSRVPLRNAAGKKVLAKKAAPKRSLAKVSNKLILKPAIKYLSNLAEFQKAIKSKNLVVIEFTATWSPPCHWINPKF